jgi:hypothetical protein
MAAKGSKFSSPNVQRLAPRAASLCDCLCGSQSGAGGGSGKAAAQATAKVSPSKKK